MHEESTIGVIITLLSGIISIIFSAKFYRKDKNKVNGFILSSLLFLNLIWYSTLTFYYLKEFFPMPGDPLRIWWFEFIMFSLIYTFRFGLLISLLLLIKHLLMRTVQQKIISIIKNVILFLLMFWIISWVEIPLLGSSGIADQLMILTHLLIYVSVIAASVYLNHSSGFLYKEKMKKAVTYLTLIIIIPFVIGSLKLVIGSAITKISPFFERGMVYFYISAYNLMMMFWLTRFSYLISQHRFDGIGAGQNGFKAFVEHYGISKRESEVIKLICEGKSKKEIAGKLFISIDTVKDHNYNIYQKTDVKSRMQLINIVNEYYMQN